MEHRPNQTGPEIAGTGVSAEDAAGATAAVPDEAPRTATTTEEIDNTITHPGSVRINVTGAFIVEDETATPVAADSAAAGASVPSGNGLGSDIRLPNHTGVVSHVAVDIGGSLAKLVYFTRETPDGGGAGAAASGGRLNFTSFETDRIDDCIAFMRGLKEKQQMLMKLKPSAAAGAPNGIDAGPVSVQGAPRGEAEATVDEGDAAAEKLCVMATGGGAYKYYDRIREALGVDVLREDEMECLIIGEAIREPGSYRGMRANPSSGLDFFITEIPREVFTYSESEPMHFEPPNAAPYPYLLANIGSGVSFLKVSGSRDYERVGGTSLGGGTLWGLLSLLTGARSFDEMLELAARGDNTKVDMLVGDIYGTDYSKIGLKSSTIASSFGKVWSMKRKAEQEAEDSGGLASGDHHGPQWKQAQAQLTAADISRSLLFAISNNIGQLAYLHSQIHSLNNIYFGGSFIRGHRQTMNTLSYAIRFWSKGTKQAYFLRHEGYLGAVGAFLKRQPRNWGRRNSLEEAAMSRRFARGGASA